MDFYSFALAKPEKMLVDANKPPKFYKLLAREGFVTKIELPYSFVRENKKMLAKTCLLGVGGNSWEVKIVKEKSKYFICKGEWPQFVVHQKLELWDVLLFLLIDKSEFHVVPYTQKCRKNFREKRLAFEELSSSSEDEIGPSRKSKKVKVDDAIEISDCEEESSDTSSDDESTDGDIKPSCSRQAKYKKPKREMVSAGSTEDEDENGSDQEDGRFRKKNRWSVMNFNDKEPSYEMVVKKSHRTFMTVPMNFAKRTGMIDMKKMRLVNSGGKEWRVNIVHIGAGVRITRGWDDFRTQNKIANGETCRFKLIQGNGGSNVLQVQRIPTPRSLQY